MTNNLSKCLNVKKKRPNLDPKFAQIGLKQKEVK